MTNPANSNDEALSADELDRVTGGIIIIGGHNLELIRSSSMLERVALNPQPLPPMPAPFRWLSFGR